MAFFRTNILWDDDSKDTLVFKFPFRNAGREVNNRSTLTVKESQVAIFVHKGQIADVFGPGLYNLGTEIFPILTRLTSWKYAFETPITVDVYFINTKQFTDIKWGTMNPIMMRDPEFGMIRVRGFGAFAFRVYDPGVFLKELFGTNSSFKTEDITGYLKTMLLSSLADALGESRISAIDLAANTLEFNTIVKAKIQDKFREIGLEMTNLFIENMSVPEEVERAIDERSKIGVLKDETDAMMRISAAEALGDAAKNPGSAGTFIGAGVGLGAGAGLGGMMAGAFSGGAAATSGGAGGGATVTTCTACGESIPAGSNFCPICGARQERDSFCPDCGARVSAGSRFCSGCGKRLV